MNRGFKHWVWIAMALLVLGAGGGHLLGELWPDAAVYASRQAVSDLPPFTGEVTFLYFNDPDKAAEFYGETLGLVKTFDAEWVRIFTISPSSSVALIDGAVGAHKPSADKPVTLAMVVSELEDVDRWYEHLKAQGVSIHMPPFDAPSVNVREFRFTDPEGYSLEIFAWLSK